MLILLARVFLRRGRRGATLLGVFDVPPPPPPPPPLLLLPPGKDAGITVPPADLAIPPPPTPDFFCFDGCCLTLTPVVDDDAGTDAPAVDVAATALDDGCGGVGRGLLGGMLSLQ